MHRHVCSNILDMPTCVVVTAIQQYADGEIQLFEFKYKLKIGYQSVLSPLFGLCCTCNRLLMTCIIIDFENTHYGDMVEISQIPQICC